MSLTTVKRALSILLMLLLTAAVLVHITNSQRGLYETCRNNITSPLNLDYPQSVDIGQNISLSCTRICGTNAKWRFLFLDNNGIRFFDIDVDYMNVHGNSLGIVPVPVNQTYNVTIKVTRLNSADVPCSPGQANKPTKTCNLCNGTVIEVLHWHFDMTIFNVPKALDGTVVMCAIDYDNRVLDHHHDVFLSNAIVISVNALDGTVVMCAIDYDNRVLDHHHDVFLSNAIVISVNDIDTTVDPPSITITASSTSDQPTNTPATSDQPTGTPGLKSSSVVFEVEDNTASITCSFAHESNATGCKVYFYNSTSMVPLFDEEIRRKQDSDFATKNIPLTGTRLNGIPHDQIRVQTAELRADGSQRLPVESPVCVRAEPPPTEEEYLVPVLGSITVFLAALTLLLIFAFILLCKEYQALRTKYSRVSINARRDSRFKKQTMHAV